MITKFFLYFIHERIWDKVKIGKKDITPFVLWFTGLSGSGKSTLAEAVYGKLKHSGYRIEHLDGDKVRSIFPKTGFSKEERNNHIRRVGFLASMLEKNGVMVTASFISPYKEARQFVRELCQNFVLTYVSAPLEVCEKRDPKGMYKKARAGQIKNFTGVDDAYQAPENPEIVVDTDKETIEESCQKVIVFLKNKGYI
ncbi:MAG: adenylyl-sulfate kinase [Candidatus Omnitrophica bacterium]|nr:adenylyl-sulfate kinase [Candidatus Omnitrophota bacterium]